THDIIDARPWPHGGGGPGASVREPPLGLFAWLRRWIHRLFWRWCCVSPHRAQQLFDLLSARTCDPLTVPPPCIPFLYPDDGCWARAHEMCRLLLAEGIWPRKVWIDGNLHTLTRNNPQCYVDWGWHVAPTICVRLRFWHAEQMVIDPSLFTTPVTQTTWKGVQGDPSALLTPTAWTVYWRNYIPTDPNYVDTNYRLDYYRLQLKNRSLLPNGPPPYAFCP
ncbi:MAG TPA: protein-glutamine glutaminase family protein, partial [Gemmatimonadales bacterium]|nr:protein-glutamine glutaminase family protein [Gemmatimonadales bacterium]